MIWQTVPSFPAYEVSEAGAVRRVAKGIRGGEIGKVMKPYRREDGYNMYILRRDNRSFHKKAHQLVIEAFVGPKPFDGAEVCHIDGSRSNDHWTNLRWDSRSGNHADKVEHGTAARGTKHPHAKLDDAKVRQIFQWLEIPLTHEEIARRLGLRQPAISRVVSGDRWLTKEADELREAYRARRG
jgi:hypothetical protein